MTSLEVAMAAHYWLSNAVENWSVFLACCLTRNYNNLISACEKVKAVAQGCWMFLCFRFQDKTSTVTVRNYSFISLVTRRNRRCQFSYSSSPLIFKPLIQVLQTSPGRMEHCFTHLTFAFHASFRAALVSEIRLLGNLHLPRCTLNWL